MNLRVNLRVWPHRRQVQIEPVLDDNLEITQFMAILNEIDMMPSLECF